MNKLLGIFFFLLLVVSAHAQGVIVGRVTDADTHEPLGFANITIKLQDGKTLGTSTDLDGKYTLKVEPGTYDLEASYVGFVADKLTVDVGTDVVIADFGLSPSMNFIGCPIVLDIRPYTVQKISEKDLEKENLGQDVPYLLKMTPSAVVTSDAGAGVGYSAIRVRGSDQTNINVTVNNIPLNDPESHQVYWVDLPDIMASASSLEIERGVGTSKNGAGAFGANINVSTKQPADKPGFSFASTVGSFNTLKGSLDVNTGKIKDRFSFNGRVSAIQSDGYVDRAASDLVSYFLAGNYSYGKHSVQLNTFSGHEITYQAWNGVPINYIKIDSLRTYNSAGTSKSGRPYAKEVDNYTQTHYQAIYGGRFGGVGVNAALHYTKGYGYYENYKSEKGSKMFAYNIDGFNPADTVPNRINLIRRKWLDNDFYGAVLDVNIPLDKMRLKLGGGWNQYLGNHYGRIVWSDIIPVPYDYEYYQNDATKTDFNVFAKASKSYNKINTFVDVQYRTVDYAFLGKDPDGNDLPAKVHHQFINPKAGASYRLNSGIVYATFATAHREPNRGDYKDSSPNSRPKAERLLNWELGLRKQKYGLRKLNYELNAYFMQYKDQLVLTGQLNDVGEYVRTNVPKSYRLGLELMANYRTANHWGFAGNVTLSQNKIEEFTEYIDNWDTWAQEKIVHKNTDLAFSPALIGALTIEYSMLNDRLNTALSGKYVGKQYLDNTSNDKTSLPAYFYNDLKINYLLKASKVKYLLSLKVNNLFNQLYSTNGWAYRYRTDNPYIGPYDQSETGNTYSQVGLYPQAGVNYLLGLVIKF